MKKCAAVLFLFLLSLGCQSQATEAAGSALYVSDEEDAEMNKAIQTANETIGVFQKAFKSKFKSFTGFCIKVKFDTTDGGAEHIWITDLEWVDNQFYGLVGNTPERVEGLIAGSRIKIDQDRISDWMYFEGNRLRGGYTIRVIRDRMSKTERKAFDKESGYVIE